MFMDGNFYLGLATGIMISICLIVFWKSQQEAVLRYHRKNEDTQRITIGELQLRIKDMNEENRRIKQMLAMAQPVKMTSSAKQKGKIDIPISYTDYREEVKNG